MHSHHLTIASPSQVRGSQQEPPRGEAAVPLGGSGGAAQGVSVTPHGTS